MKSELNYKSYLDRLMENKSGELFTNAGDEHAAILMGKLFSHTSPKFEKVRMFCEGFKSDLIMREPYHTALSDFLTRGGVLEVLVEDNESANEKSLQYINQLKEKGASITFKKITDDDKRAAFLEIPHYNFSVFGEEMFRFEYDPKDKKALASFNDIGRTKALIEHFDSLFENGGEVTLNSDKSVA